MKQRIRLTESQLHNIIRKCVNEAVNELDPRTYASYAAKRQAQGQTEKAKEGREAAVNAWNREYGYYDKRTPNGFQAKGYIPGYTSTTYQMRQEIGDDGNYNGNYYTRGWKSQNYPGDDNMKDTETYSEYHPSTGTANNRTYRGNLKYNTVGSIGKLGYNEPKYGDYNNSAMIDQNNYHIPNLYGQSKGDEVARQMTTGTGVYIKGKGWQ